jgi:hypothetical protein
VADFPLTLRLVAALAELLAAALAGRERSAACFAGTAFFPVVLFLAGATFLVAVERPLVAAATVVRSRLIWRRTSSAAGVVEADDTRRVAFGG